jgi:hypothetical protein
MLYLKFKVSNPKAKFVPREHEIYHRITPYVVVFDVAGDFSHITRVILFAYNILRSDAIRFFNFRKCFLKNFLNCEECQILAFIKIKHRKSFISSTWRLSIFGVIYHLQTLCTGDSAKYYPQ